MGTSTEQPHPWIAERRRHGPHLTADERVGFNGRLATIITKGVGTMWAFYLAAVILAGWMLLSLVGLIKFDPYPFAFLLFLGNVVQLLLMFVIMVGQQVIGAASDKRAVQTYKDAEAILHECLRLQKHLQEQDEVLRGIGPAEHPGRP
ncbi:MAG: DUF1003 domain-containing protein [Candidatus Dormibacteraeota bacterium]|jgi:uncharacterized membrane protein|nr:DUF1003 domain-containing protein [Candidatus Dormibacteraeota bacterium]